MEFRRLGEGRSVQQPAVERGELTPERAAFEDEFDFDGVRVDGGDQAGVIGEGSLARSVLQRVDLSGARLGPLTMADVVLDDVDLSNTVLQRVTARKVELLRCRSIGLQLSFELAAELYVEDCRLEYASIHVERNKGVLAFRDCSFRETRLSGDLSNAVFLNCDFAETDFQLSRAAGCDLSGSRLVGARGLLTLRGAEITREQAVSVADQLAAEAGLAVRD